MLTSIYTKGFHGLQATSRRLQATGGRLQATGNRLQARSNRAARSFRLQTGGTGSRLQATGCKLQATSIMCGVGARMMASFQKAVISHCICC